MERMMETQRDDNVLNERFAEAFYNGGRYNPIFLFVAGTGVFVIYLLTVLGILGNPAWQLLVVGGATYFLALTQWGVLMLFARRKRGLAAYSLSALFAVVFAIVLTYFWQGIIFVAIPVVLVVLFTVLNAGMPRKNIFWLVAALLSVAGIVFADFTAKANAALERLEFISTASIASLAFLGATGLLLLTITIISQNRNFKSLQGLLLTSFVIIVTIPTVMATVLSGISAYANSQLQTFNTLKAIANLKENQITLLVNEIKTDAEKIQGDILFKQNMLPVLNPGNASPEEIALNQENARAYLLTIQKDQDAYSEIMVLNNQGITVLSTDFEHEGASYESQLFYRQGGVKFFTGFADIPDFGSQNLVVATPLFDKNGQIIRGVIVLRSDAGSIKKIMESTPGFTEAETYLVDKNYNPVTKTRTETQTVRTTAALGALLDNRDGQETYDNYAGESVLGYYKWYEPMQMAVIAEAPVSFVVTSSLRSLTGSSLLALFVIGIAIAAVAIAAKSITDPITTLAKITESYAIGKFSSRANVDRKDEIGALAHSYNEMASQLQDIIGKLEQRVADRTKELESQTLRVRVAAEITRDAASARNLNELLNSTAKLILERFNFYHTGIFLTEKTGEFAILTASSTEAGSQMIAGNYKVRVGDLDIVGRVAANGEPRITLDTNTDAARSSTPLLPNTRSEMALPLKASNTVIGVLHVQSDQPHAFSQDDITIMQVMADQLATAIERTRLLDEVERNLKELENAYGQYTSEGWQKLGISGRIRNRGYRFDNIRIEPITNSPDLGSEALKTGTSVYSNSDNVAIPIKLRGKVIGVVTAKLKEGHSQGTVSALESATDRLAAALESARLYEEARARADREQAIAQVTSKISGATEFDAILRTTVEEIGKSLENSEVSIQIVSDLNEQAD